MKKLFVLLPFIVFAAISCQNRLLMAELDELKAKADLEKQNVALVEKYIEAWNTKDLQLIYEMLDPRYKLHLPSINPNTMSNEQFKAWYESIYQAFPDVHYDIKEIFADGDKVCVQWIFTGTHEGDFQGIPATGKRIEVSAIEICMIQDGKIIEEKAETDSQGWIQQLGL